MAGFQSFMVQSIIFSWYFASSAIDVAPLSLRFIE